MHAAAFNIPVETNAQLHQFTAAKLRAFSATVTGPRQARRRFNAARFFAELLGNLAALPPEGSACGRDVFMRGCEARHTQATACPAIIGPSAKQKVVLKHFAPDYFHGRGNTMQYNPSIKTLSVGHAPKTGGLIGKMATALLITFAAFLLLTMAEFQFGSPQIIEELFLAQ